MVSVASVVSQSSNAGSGQPSERSAQAADSDWLNKYATPVSTGPVVVPAPSAALAEQINLGARAFAEFNETLSRIMDYGLIKTWAERNAEREEQLGLPLSGWTGRDPASAPALAGSSAGTPAATAVPDDASSQAAAALTSSVTPEQGVVPQDRTSGGLTEVSPASTPSVATVSAPLPAPSAALAEQINLGTRAFAEFNETLSRIMDYGLIKTWAERNAEREEQLGLPISGWTGKEPSSSTVLGGLQTAPPAQAGETGGTAGSAAVPATVLSAGPASDPPAPVTSSTVQPTPAVLSGAISEGDGGGSMGDDEPVATTAVASEGGAASSATSTPGPLPSLSSLTASSSHASSNWEPPSTWYVTNEPYAVRLAATERYRQMNLGSLQKTLFGGA